MIRALALLLVCQLVGEIVARVVALPVPGPVIGLALLAIGAILHARVTGGDASAIETTDLGRIATALLGSLGLLFVPAGVGVITQLDVLASNLVAVAVAILLSTFAGLLVTGWLMQRLAGAEEG